MIQAFTIVYQPPIVEGLNVISNNRRQSQKKNYLGVCVLILMSQLGVGNITQQSSDNISYKSHDYPRMINFNHLTIQILLYLSGSSIYFSCQNSCFNKINLLYDYQ